MWDCVTCGCRAIAHSLGFCPHCFGEKDLPKVAVDASADYDPPAEGETIFKRAGKKAQLCPGGH